MAGGTSNIRRVNVTQDKSPLMAPIPRSISPLGNRSVQPTITRARRNPPQPKNTRDYGKTPATGGFDIPGFGPGSEQE